MLNKLNKNIVVVDLNAAVVQNAVADLNANAKK